MSEKRKFQISALKDSFIIGFSDGLTVPFALTAGLSSLGSSKLVITAGLAELVSGSISMGLGAYLAASTSVPMEKAESILQRYGVSAGTSDVVCAELDSAFEQDFSGRIPKPWLSAIVMGLSYFIGGLLPMIPYFITTEVMRALFISIGITVAILLVFGAVKEWISVGGKMNMFRGAIETLIVGAAAAGASYGIVRAIDQGQVV